MRMLAGCATVIVALFGLMVILSVVWSIAIPSIHQIPAGILEAIDGNQALPRGVEVSARWSFLVVFGAIFLTSLVFSSFVFRRSRTEKRPDVTEEVRLMQEIYRTMASLEDRVEALETLLLEKSHRERRS